MDKHITTVGAAVFTAANLGRPLVKKGLELIDNLLLEPTKVAGEMLTDTLRGLQLENRIIIAASAAKKCSGLPRSSLRMLPDFVLPYLDGAGNVSSPDLQELWAELLASATQTEEAQHPIFLSILRQMGTREAKFLRDNLALLGSTVGMSPETVVTVELQMLLTLGVIEKVNEIESSNSIRGNYATFYSPNARVSLRLKAYILSTIGVRFVAFVMPDQLKSANKVRTVKKRKVRNGKK